MPSCSCTLERVGRGSSWAGPPVTPVSEQGGRGDAQAKENSFLGAGRRSSQSLVKMQYPPLKKPPSGTHKSSEDVQAHFAKKSLNFSQYLKTSKDPRLLHQLSLQLVQNLSQSDEASQLPRPRLPFLLSQRATQDLLNRSPRTHPADPPGSRPRFAPEHSNSVLATFSSESKGRSLKPGTRAQPRFRSEMHLHLGQRARAERVCSSLKAQSQVLKASATPGKSEYVRSPLRPVLKNATSVRPASLLGQSESERQALARDRDPSLLKISSKSEPKSMLSESQAISRAPRSGESKLDCLLYSQPRLSSRDLDPRAADFPNAHAPNPTAFASPPGVGSGGEVAGDFWAGQSPGQAPQKSGSAVERRGPERSSTGLGRAEPAPGRPRSTFPGSSSLPQGSPAPPSDSLKRAMVKYKTVMSRVNPHFHSSLLKGLSSKDFSGEVRRWAAESGAPGPQTFATPHSTLTDNEIQIKVIRALTNTSETPHLAGRPNSDATSKRSTAENAEDAPLRSFSRFGSQATAQPRPTLSLAGARGLGLHFGPGQKKITEELEDADQKPDAGGVPSSHWAAPGQVRGAEFALTTPDAGPRIAPSQSTPGQKQFFSTAPVKIVSGLSKASLKKPFSRAATLVSRLKGSRLHLQNRSLAEQRFSISPGASRENSFSRKVPLESLRGNPALCGEHGALSRGLLGLQGLLVAKLQRHLATGFFQVMRASEAAPPRRGLSFAQPGSREKEPTEVSNLYRLDWSERDGRNSPQWRSAQRKSTLRSKLTGGTQGSQPVTPSSRRAGRPDRSLFLKKGGPPSPGLKRQGAPFADAGEPPSGRERRRRRVPLAERADRLRLLRKGFGRLRSLLLRKELKKIARQFYRFSLKRRLFAKLKQIRRFQLENSFVLS